MGKVITKTYAASTDAPFTRGFTSDNPTTSFELIDVVLASAVTPVTSEVLTIKSSTPTSPDIIEDDEADLSDSTYTGKPRRFDKEFSSDTTITVSYPNTDGNSLTLVIRYEVLAK
jgi:hypothetical protein